ncbi:MAG: esterase-like activity of phytase family protein [Proteobacteria bacterium]|nr:esterase-like activity of phytase family protein [Pseudomonadota bacterium]
MIGGGALRLAARPFVFLGLLLAAACIAAPPTTPVGAQSLALEVHAESIPLKLDDREARQVGRLIWRGGLSLTAKSSNFGGWSDLYVTPDGRQLRAISDVGGWFTAAIDYDKAGDLTGLSDARIGPLHGLDGKPLVNKAWADSEGMARLPDGSWLVSFERHHRIWHYPTLDGVPVPLNDPPDIERQPDNGGIETLTALPDGTVIAISEEYREQRGAVVGWIGKPAGEGRYAWQKFQYDTIPDFHPTAIVQLPDGAFATLERAYDVVRGVRVRVMRFAAEQLKPGAMVKPEELAFLASPYAVDNLEGISVSKGPRGETLLWLISDDNFNPVQRNLLLLFELAL